MHRTIYLFYDVGGSHKNSNNAHISLIQATIQSSAKTNESSHLAHVNISALYNIVVVVAVYTEACFAWYPCYICFALCALVFLRIS